MRDLSEYRFLDPELQKCPYEFYKRLHDEAPVYLEPETGFYIVSRHADLLSAKRNIGVFSNVVDVNSISKITPQEAHDIYKTGYERPHTLHRTDPPVHSAHRRLVDRAFTLPRVKSMTPYIESIVKDLMDQFPSDGLIDFVSQYAIRLPCYVIADQLGVPREDAIKLKYWSDALLDPGGMMIDVDREIECAQQVVEFQRYFAARIEERRSSPRDDILTDLSRHMDGDDPLSIEQILNILEQVVTGGNESTTGLMGSALLMLIQNPEQEALLRSDLSRVPVFIEEALRMESPVQSNFRRTTEEVELGGTMIPKGALVLMRYGAANRDELKFEHSAQMNICRQNVRSHVAFGSGIHTCPGAMLARQEAISTFQELLTRYRKFELMDSYENLRYSPTFFLRGLKKLPVKLIA